MKTILYRSKLVVDGCFPDRFAGAFASNADSIMLENEDHVSAELKPFARKSIVEFLSSGQGTSGKVVQVRVNAFGSPYYGDDMAAFVISGVDILNLPKAESPDQIVAMAATIAKLEHERGIEGMRILATIETPAALRRASEIARSHPRLCGLQIGYEDLFSPYSIRRTGPAADVTRFVVKMAAAEAGVDAYDGGIAKGPDNVYRHDALNAVAMGFAGKSCSNSAQVDIANEVFARAGG